MGVRVSKPDWARIYMSSMGPPYNVPQHRWGPCRFCKADGWEKHGATTSRLYDHDRPQGGRCLRAAENRGPSECSVCRRAHGPEISHACE